MITRFAPSPTGQLHLGHAYSACLAHDLAQEAGGTFLLRMEDIDQTRSQPRWEAQILDDLDWLGLTWPVPVLRQSDRLPAYEAALKTLWAQGLLYPCFCNRRDILAALEAPQEGVATGPDGIVYPGTCRPAVPPSGDMPPDATLRIDMRRATACLGFPLEFQECLLDGSGTRGISAAYLVSQVGDAVLRRRDIAGAYHLSVVVDDGYQGITDVVRGSDLYEATFLHVLLQRLLGLATPRYHHHGLIRDENGRRLAKRDDARAIAAFRADGYTPDDIRRMIGSG